MSIKELLLTSLAEEGGEVAKDCCKALRFGLDDRFTSDPTGPPADNGPTNAERIVQELTDVLAVAELLAEMGWIGRDWDDPQMKQKKKEKVLAFIGYSQRVGNLSHSRDYQKLDKIIQSSK